MKYYYFQLIYLKEHLNLFNTMKRNSTGQILFFHLLNQHFCRSKNYIWKLNASKTLYELLSRLEFPLLKSFTLAITPILEKI